MEKVVIVILNYLNYEDTIECIESLINDEYKKIEIVIVDNGSNNGSWEKLNQLYLNIKNIYIIQSKKNVGFAQGNNLGILYAKEKLHSNFVLLVNNDTIFKDKKLITELMNAYENDVAIIGPRIISANELEQNPVRTEFTKSILKEQMKYYHSVTYKFESFKCKLKNNKLYKSLKNVKILMKFKRKLFEDTTINMKKVRQSICSEELVLHGACMLLTKDYFKYYPYLFPKTFLYYEENILTLITSKVNLKKKFINNVWIYHKEDQSSEMSFNNSNSIKAKYIIKSMEECKKIFDLNYEDIIKKFS